MELELLPGSVPAEVERAARRAAEVLGAGGVVVHPTETVYGIGGDGSVASNELIARIKGRDDVQPLILLIPDLEALRRFLPGLEWPDSAETLARRFWPGPLTLVVRCPGAPPGLAGPGHGVAVRATPNAMVKAILRHWRRPMTSSSANPSGAPPPRTLEEALAVFESKPDLGRPALAIDSGPTGAALASTVVSLVGSPARVLREGRIGHAELEQVLPDIAGRKTDG